MATPLICNQVIVGSNPIASSKINKKFLEILLTNHYLHNIIEL